MCEGWHDAVRVHRLALNWNWARKSTGNMYQSSQRCPNCMTNIHWYQVQHFHSLAAIWSWWPDRNRHRKHARWWSHQCRLPENEDIQIHFIEIPPCYILTLISSICKYSLTAKKTISKRPIISSCIGVILPKRQPILIRTEAVAISAPIMFSRDSLGIEDEIWNQLKKKLKRLSLT